ncbi:hypothetical protein [Acidithiobacillus ferrooxidans]|uniref:hypothetical protein n=1 Tax=Acidithiobacillus ferrooxidans TaxID=920 RepID=UPI001D010CED|nr:hypothetical protein [Acidithiobacillus ferrooxidans]
MEQQYNRLQQEAQGVMQSLQALAGKLKTAADGGNQDAREWLLDLKELALDIQTEQQQVMNVMQAMHLAVQNDISSMQGQGASGSRAITPKLRRTCHNRAMLPSSGAADS